MKPLRTATSALSVSLSGSSRASNDFFKNLAFVDQIGQSPVARLVFELTAGRISLLPKELLDTEPNHPE